MTAVIFSEICVIWHIDKQSSKAYCLIISLKLEVLHTSQTLHWTWKLCIDFPIIFVFPVSEHCIHIIAFSQHPVEIVDVTRPHLLMCSCRTRRARLEIDTNFQSLVWVAHRLGFQSTYPYEKNFTHKTCSNTTYATAHKEGQMFLSVSFWCYFRLSELRPESVTI